MASFFQPKLFSLFRTGMDRHQFSRDVLSGIVVGIVAMPLAIAFAVASGVSPEKGLITSIVAGFLISALGGSRVQIAGPTGAFVVIVYAIVQQYGLDGLAISTMLAGLLLIFFGVIQLGSLLKYFPHPLIVGFTSGIALVIFTTQVKDALGLPFQDLPSEFHEKWMFYATHGADIRWMSVGLTLLTILITVGMKRITGKIPGSFVAILVVTSLVRIFHLDVATIETHFGSIPHTLHFELPTVRLTDIPKYMAPALTIAMLGGIESLLSAVVADGMIGGKHRSNTELIAQGIGNLVSPLFGGIPATGAIARTATNVKNGGRTPVAGIVHALVLLLIMLFLGNLAKLIPMSCLAGILMVVAYNMSEWRSFLSVLKGSWFDILILLTTFVLTVFFDLTLAVEIGVVLSAILFMKRMADMSDKRLTQGVDNDVIENYEGLPDGLNVYEISGPLFFASARRYSEVIEEIGLRGRILIIRMRHLSFIDQTGLRNLKDTVRILSSKGIRVMLSGVHPDVLTDLTKYGLMELIPDHHVFDSFQEALESAGKFLEEE